jgi:hypothetical protein
MEARNCRSFFVTVIAVLLITEVCFAYDNGDFQYWSKAGLAFDINKDWAVTFEEEFRLGDNAGKLYYHSSDLGFLYRGFADWIDLGVNYGQVFEKDSSDVWRTEKRPHFNVTLKGQLFNFDLSDRSRLEYRDRENKKDVWRYRNKLTVKLPAAFTKFKLQPYVADEVFINFDKEDFNKNRLYSGILFSLSKNIKGDIFYLWQSSKSDGNWEDINVLGTQLKFCF